MKMRLTGYLTTLGSYIKQPAKRNLIKYSFSLSGKKGLEIGGPSSFFSLRGYCPVYVSAEGIDGVNYSENTVWEGAIKEGPNYRYLNRVGYQYIREATDLTGIEDARYDFILSCHSLEHIANPLKALGEWNRVLKAGGEFILVLPDKRHTMDENRLYTTLAHLRDDFEKDTQEDDTTHFKEVLDSVDTQKYPETGGFDTLAQLVNDNLRSRCVHHHVFSLELIREMLNEVGFDVINQQEVAPFHLVTLAKKRL